MISGGTRSAQCVELGAASVPLIHPALSSNGHNLAVQHFTRRRSEQRLNRAPDHAAVFPCLRAKAVNLSVDAALLRAARDRDINLSATLERRWKRPCASIGANAGWPRTRQGIAAYNEQVEAHGAFADTLRSF